MNQKFSSRTSKNRILCWLNKDENIQSNKFSNINSRTKCEMCSKLAQELPDVALVSLLLTFNVFDRLLYCFFADFKHVKMADGILYCLNLNLSLCFRFRSWSLVAFQTKLYVTSVNNSFESMPIFCLKELHLRCCIELESNIVKDQQKF